MTRGAVSGMISIGTAAKTEISLAIAPVTESVDNHTRQKLTASAVVTLDQGAITNICFIWIKIVKASDGTTPSPAAITLNSGSEVDAGDHSEILMVCNPKASASITAVKVTPTEAAIIEYILAGDA